MYNLIKKKKKFPSVFLLVDHCTCVISSFCKRIIDKIQ